uniref:Uncharacterized protein n=1 Tax=Arundo donax TaxID=35708 RepID=A0A0A9C9N6_ARUDO
MKARLLPIV